MAQDAEKLAATADRIKELRGETRGPQQPVADAVGVTLRAYQDWEAGRMGISGEHLKALAAFFGVTPDYIEYGVTKRERGDTPDLAVSRLESIEARLSSLVDSLSELDEQVRLMRGETAARDAEVLKRLGEGLSPSPRSQRRQPQ